MAAPLDVSRLPQDVFDTVIQHLHDDTRALRSCALTCHAWLRTSQRCLFESISLSDAGSARALIELLERAPYLVPFVRQLRIDAGQGYLDYAPPWITPTLSRALVNRLSSLDSLTVEQLSWKALAPQDRVRFLRFPSITRLTLNYCYFPSFDDFSDVLALEDAPRLRRLEMYYILWDGFMRTPGRTSPGCPTRCASVERSWTPEREGQSKPLALEELSLAFCQQGEIFQWLLDGAFALRIRRLELAKFVSADLKKAGLFLRRLGESLEHLSLGLSNWDGGRQDAVHEKLSLAHSPALRSLYILELDTHARARPIAWVPRLVASASRTALEEVRLDLRAANCTAARECIDWPALARAMPDSARLVVVLGPGVDAARVPACLRARMPVMQEKGMLEFEVPEPPPCSP